MVRTAPTSGTATRRTARADARTTASIAKTIRQPVRSTRLAAATPQNAMPAGTKVLHSDSVKGWCLGSEVAASKEGAATTTSR